MNLVWKLLRQHVSIPQFVGFFFANLFGMFIVLLGIQFYCDVLPVFTAEDSFMKADYIMVSKRIGTASTLSGRSTTFSAAELADMAAQPFISKAGAFTSNEFKVYARMGVNGTSILNSEIFLESIPDDFIDIPLDDWHYAEGSHEVPIILPRTYINMYNFGFAQSRKLPKISDGLMGMIDLEMNLHGQERQDDYTGRVVGFSSRLNTILVPQAFMDYANARYASETHPEPSRLLVQVTNPADEGFSKYIEKKGYEMEDDRLNAEKTTYFLRLVVTLVMVIGLIISLLSFYILMLSIYLLVQKNSSKLENLLLIGYSPARVGAPYQWLTIILNAAVLLIALIALFFVRRYYMDMVYALFPQMEEGTMLPALLVGLGLFLLVTLMNQLAIQRKVMAIWKRKE